MFIQRFVFFVMRLLFLITLPRCSQAWLCSTFWLAPWMHSPGWSTDSWRPGSLPRECSDSYNLMNSIGASIITSSVTMAGDSLKTITASLVVRKATRTLILMLLVVVAMVVGVVCGSEMVASHGGERIAVVGLKPVSPGFNSWWLLAICIFLYFAS